MSYGEKYLLGLLILTATSDTSSDVSAVVRLLVLGVLFVLFVNWQTMPWSKKP